MYSLGLTLWKSGSNSLPRKGKFNDYEFRWPNCDSGAVFHSSLSDLSALLLFCNHFGSRKYLEAFQDATLTAEMNGTIRLPGNDQVEDDNSAKHEKSDLKKERKSGGKYASKPVGR
ncbi:hypothetical protein B0H14DRAFT_2645536 [Mycena olivaceomarginata]|nr:hypothetical protein B0H14DRAFT_2645536 [Mycena olivaceomarginata]